MGSSPSSELKHKMSAFMIKPTKVWVTQQISLKLGSFDYEVCASPFQYETQQENGSKSLELIELQEIFKKQYQNELNIQFDPNLKWDFGRLSSYLRIGRYSPLYYDDIGLINNKFLMQKGQFTKKWDEAFDAAIQKYLTATQLEDEKIHIQKKNLCIMDWIHYRTLVVYAYRDEKISFNQIIKNRIATKYQIYMKQKFESKIINDKYKIEKLLRRLTKFEVDIFFLQNIDARILNYIEKKTNKFRIARCRYSKSAILISQSGFKKIVGDSLRPLVHYNKKYLDPTKIYEMGEEFDFGQRQLSLEGLQFETKSHRNFELIKKQPATKRLFLKKLQSQLQIFPQGTKSQKKLTKASSVSSNNIICQQVQTQRQSIKAKSMSVIPEQYQKLGEQVSMGDYKKDSESSSYRKIESQYQLAYIDPEVFKGLAWNSSTLVQFLSNIILITSSLDLQFQQAQYQKMVDSLRTLHKMYPKHVIVAAVVIQKDLPPKDFEGFHIFPSQNQQSIPTVFKKISLMQPKIHKAGKLIKNTEDYFVTTVGLKQAMVMDIDQKQAQTNPRLIPNQSHPYDHYLLSATLTCTVTKKLIKWQQQ